MALALFARQPLSDPSEDEKLNFGDQQSMDDYSDAANDTEALHESNSPLGLRHSRSSLLRTRFLRRPVLLVAATALFLGLTLAALYSLHLDPESRPPVTIPLLEDTPVSPPHSQWVLGPATESLRDNLRNDTQYITAWIAAGWTNDFMTYANLVYLATLTGRAAVLPPFVPSHIPASAGSIHVGEVFDLPRMSRLMHGQPILEWRDIKIPTSPFVDPVGCWSIWSTSQKETDPEHRPRSNQIEGLLSLDVSYTPVPAKAIMYPQIYNDFHTRFGDLAAIAFPDGRRAANLPDRAPFPSPRGQTALPDDHLACYDFPYYVSEVDAHEYTYDYSPMWRFVGKHAHFTPRMEALARDAIRRTIGLEQGADLPPFISIHVRRGDFKVYCNNGQGGIRPDCFPPLSAFARRVKDAQDELRARRGMEVSEVLVTSDETDEMWWAEVEAFGWRRMNHRALETEERLGLWYPVLLDAVVQSLGAGFVGTDKSTMSIMARRRVIDWNDGVGVEVRWGREGADDH